MADLTQFVNPFERYWVCVAVAFRVSVTETQEWLWSNEILGNAYLDEKDWRLLPVQQSFRNCSVCDGHNIVLIFEVLSVASVSASHSGGCRESLIVPRCGEVAASRIES